jgi:hypothetical protein
MNEEIEEENKVETNEISPTVLFTDTPRNDIEDKGTHIFKTPLKPILFYYIKTICKYNPLTQQTSVIEYEEVGEELIDESQANPREFEQDLILAGGESDEEDNTDEIDSSNKETGDLHISPEPELDEQKDENEFIHKLVVDHFEHNEEKLDELDNEWGGDLVMDIDDELESDIDDDLDLDDQQNPESNDKESDHDLPQHNEPQDVEAPIDNSEEEVKDEVSNKSENEAKDITLDYV